MDGTRPVVVAGAELIGADDEALWAMAAGIVAALRDSAPRLPVEHGGNLRLADPDGLADLPLRQPGRGQPPDLPH